MEVFNSSTRVRGRTLLRTLAMVLCGVLLVGGLAWTLTQDLSTPGTSGSKEVSFTEEEAVPAAVQEVPELYNASEVEGALVDAGLKIGDRNEASHDAIPAGHVIEQYPRAGTTVEEGRAVDVAVSTGPEQIPAALRSAPTGVGAGSQQPPATQVAAPGATDPKQAPVAVRAASEAAPTSVDADPRQEGDAARAASITSQTASTSPASDKTEKKGKKTEKKGKK